jgi:hypothetical protein
MVNLGNSAAFGVGDPDGVSGKLGVLGAGLIY